MRFFKGHPSRGGPTIFTVGNGPRAVPRNTPNGPPPPGESASPSHYHCHCEAEGRGDRRECLWCNLLRDCANPNDVPGDCHVGLWPPRNDVVILTWSFYLWCGSGHPRRGGPTILTVGNGPRAVPRNTPNGPPPPGESGPPSHYHCHCEAEGRGNLLRDCANPNDVPGDCHVASLLAMTWWF